MKFILNILWLILGGFAIALEYFFSSLILMITIIGIPFGIQTLKMGSLAIWPFGRTAINMDMSTGCLQTLMNIIWFFCGGIWIALTHLFLGCVLFITIIGIPFGRQHFKLAGLALTPFGKDIVIDD